MSAATFSDKARMDLLRLAQMLGLDSDTHQQWLDLDYPEDEQAAVAWCMERVKGNALCIADANAAWDDEVNLMESEDWRDDHQNTIEAAKKTCDKWRLVG